MCGPIGHWTISSLFFHSLDVFNLYLYKRWRRVATRKVTGGSRIAYKYKYWTDMEGKLLYADVIHYARPKNEIKTYLRKSWTTLH